MGRAFCSFQRNVTGKAFGDNDINNALAYVIAFDETMIVEMRELAFAQDAASIAYLLESFDFLDSDVEQTDGRALDIEQHPSHRTSHRGEIHQMRFIRTD